MFIANEPHLQQLYVAHTRAQLFQSAQGRIYDYVYLLVNIRSKN